MKIKGLDLEISPFLEVKKSIQERDSPFQRHAQLEARRSR